MSSNEYLNAYSELDNYTMEELKIKKDSSSYIEIVITRKGGVFSFECQYKKREE